MDVVFIVDSSSSIGSANFEIMRNFIIRMVEVFKVGPFVTKVGGAFLECSVFSSALHIQTMLRPSMTSRAKHGFVSVRLVSLLHEILEDVPEN